MFKFLAVKSVPTLFWSSPKVLTLRPRPVSLLFLILGLGLFGLGEAMLVAAGIGVSPWTVFAQGLMLQTGWSLGTATLIISLCVIGCWWPLKQVPGIGTIANAFIIAAVLEFVLPWLPVADAFAGQLAYSLAGIVVTGFGGAVYLIANLGPGPRDGLMTGLQRLTGRPIAQVRSALEIAVVVIGFALGGSAGLGTALFAFGIGPAVALGLYLCHQLAPQEPATQ
ncbi:MAG: YczE/YyaS/YitT family protein [Litorivicinus sp.]